MSRDPDDDYLVALALAGTADAFESCISRWSFALWTGMATVSSASPRLVVTTPESLRGKVLAVDDGRVVVGRGPASDVELDEPHVSRRHAALEHLDGRTLLRDLGSSMGTRVNGSLFDGERALQHGDLVRFGVVEARYEDPLDPGDPTSVQLGVGDQRGEQINNVGGDQYNQYIRQIREERESFLREVASTKTRARRLILVGLLLFAGGGGTYGWALLRFASDASAAFSSTSYELPDVELFGPALGGVPIGLLGFAAAGIGSLLMVVGLVLHIVSTARQRRVQSSHWPAVPPPRPQHR